MLYVVVMVVVYISAVQHVSFVLSVIWCSSPDDNRTTEHCEALLQMNDGSSTDSSVNAGTLSLHWNVADN